MADGDCLRARPNFRLAWKQKKAGVELFPRCGRHDVRNGTAFDRWMTDDIKVECTGTWTETGECGTWELRPFDYVGTERLVCRLYEHLHGRGGDRTEVVGDFDMPFGVDVERVR
ncbi:MAG: hypothetical protein BMS9Abin37_0936 [Acidobacteriota bacterium]|nr:MAG: hypothetical protein BMS9Abin37_0936 [Acidobacteriota bacterium]